MKKNRGTHT